MSFNYFSFKFIFDGIFVINNNLSSNLAQLGFIKAVFP